MFYINNAFLLCGADRGSNDKTDFKPTFHSSETIDIDQKLKKSLCTFF